MTEGKYDRYDADIAEWKLRKDSYYRCDHCGNTGFRECLSDCMLIEHPAKIGKIGPVRYCGCEVSGGAIGNRQREFILNGGR